LIEPYGKTSLAELVDSIHGRARTLRITDKRNRNVDTDLGEASRNGAADIAGASSDESDFSTEVHHWPQNQLAFQLWRDSPVSSTGVLLVALGLFKVMGDLDAKRSSFAEPCDAFLA
jgi:hypothetical protein